MICDASLASKEMPSTKFTVGWLLEKLVANCESFKTTAEESPVKNVTTERIAEGEGYLSHIYRYSIEFADCRKPSFRCVAKIPLVHNFGVEVTDEETKKKQHLDMIARHNRECAFYETFKDIDDLPLPRIFFAQTMTEVNVDVGMLVMEDLSTGGTNPGPFVSVTVEQIKNVARYFAAFHAYQICSPVDTSRMRKETSWHAGADFKRILAKCSASLVAKQPAVFGPLLEKFKPGTSVEFDDYAIHERPKELGLPVLLCHGDLWGNNLLYKRNVDGTASNEVLAIVDWPETFLGNPMFDLAAYVVTGADAEVRRDVDQFIVRFYLDELSRRLETHGKTADFRVEAFEEAYNLASIVKTQEAVMNATFLAKPKKGEPDENVQEAKAEKLALRTKLMLEDAIRYLEEVAKPFVEGTLS